LLEISDDGTNWTAVSDTIIMATNFETYHYELPELANNKPELYIRWVQISNIRLDGDTESDISSQGSNRIDNVYITGINPNAERITVWPGDTNNDGIVNEEDVLPLTLYWQLEGPEPIYNSRDWEERESESWIPEEATHADANGDGVVNHMDLLPIALNFGKLRSADKQVENPKILSQLNMERLYAGEETDLFLYADSEIGLSGVSFSLNLSGIAPSKWQVSSVEPGMWGLGWKDQGRLIEFKNANEGDLSGAVSHQGPVTPNVSKQLLKITIRAVEDWNEGPIVRLNRASVITGNTIRQLNEASISADDEGDGDDVDMTIPFRTELLPNYPNPFNPSTTIQYTLERETHVRVTVYNALGRRVATLVDQHQEPGFQEVLFNAQNLSSGIYFYRIQTERITETRSMALIK
jgi:hypothetical protein